MNWMRIKLASLVIVVVTSSASMAGGFISHLPEDGVRVVYALKIVSLQSDSNRKEQLLDDDVRMEFEIASVGSGPKYKGKPTRWIEVVIRITRMGESSVQTFVCLVPESTLTSDKYAVDEIIKGASQRGDDGDINLDTSNFSDVRGSALPILLGVKPASTKALAEKTIKHDDKEYKCTGLSTVIEKPEDKATAQLDAYYSKDMPFGLVKGSLKLEIFTDKLVLEVKVKEVKRGAKSAIPIEEIVNDK